MIKQSLSRKINYAINQQMVKVGVNGVDDIYQISTSFSLFVKSSF
jgi:hypothetical protein